MNYFIISEVCIMEGEGAWDKEHRDANSSSRRNHFLGSKSQEEQEAKSTFSFWCSSSDTSRMQHKRRADSHEPGSVWHMKAAFLDRVTKEGDGKDVWHWEKGHSKEVASKIHLCIFILHKPQAEFKWCNPEDKEKIIESQAVRADFKPCFAFYVSGNWSCALPCSFLTPAFPEFVAVTCLYLSFYIYINI